MRRAPLALLTAALASTAIAAPAANADEARRLGTPYRPGEGGPRLERERGEPRRDDVPEVQDISARPTPGVGPRVFGDGRADSVAWDDPELDLEPRGWVHPVLFFAGAWSGSTSSFDEAAGGAFALMLDVCLEPRTSVHLRVGAIAMLRTETRRELMAEPLRSAVLSVRATLLAGVHLARLVAIRAGFELGEGRSFVFGLGDAGAVGFAFLGQAGLRLASGGVELGLEVAVDLREGGVIRAGMPSASIQEAAPRVSGYLALTP